MEARGRQKTWGSVAGTPPHVNLGSGGALARDNFDNFQTKIYSKSDRLLNQLLLILWRELDLYMPENAATIPKYFGQLSY